MLNFNDQKERDRAKFADGFNLMKQFVDPAKEHRTYLAVPTMREVLTQSHRKSPDEFEFVTTIEDQASNFATTMYLRDSHRNQST